MPISQPNFHTLRNEGTRLWAALPNACKEDKDIMTFKSMAIDFI